MQYNLSILNEVNCSWLGFYSVGIKKRYISSRIFGVVYSYYGLEFYPVLLFHTCLWIYTSANAYNRKTLRNYGSLSKSLSYSDIFGWIFIIGHCWFVLCSTCSNHQNVLLFCFHLSQRYLHNCAEIFEIFFLSNSNFKIKSRVLLPVNQFSLVLPTFIYFSKNIILLIDSCFEFWSQT